MKIKYLDPVQCQLVEATKEERAWLKKLLSYRASWFKRAPFGGGEVQYYDKSLLRRDHLPTGMLPRIHKAAATDDIVVEVDMADALPSLEPAGLPSLTGAKLRVDQQGLVEQAIHAQRGVVEAPTGSGKTVLMAAILSCFPTARALIVTHSADIVAQTEEELRKFGIQGVTRNGPDWERVVVCTRQYLVGKGNVLRDARKGIIRDRDIVMVDECHLFGGEGGQYATILHHTAAPIRLGFTATPAEAGEQAAACEALLGPVVASMKYDEAKEAGILADVRLELLPMPKAKGASGKGYEDTLELQVIGYRARHRAILDRAAREVRKGGKVLVFVERIEHGKNLMDMAEVMELPVSMVNGSTDKEVRNKLRKSLDKKGGRCVIASKAWREGVNIPSLTAVILAGGGKAKMSVLQAVGRGLRRAEGKDEVLIVDCIDGVGPLAAHTVERITFYIEKGWL